MLEKIKNKLYLGSTALLASPLFIKASAEENNYDGSNYLDGIGFDTDVSQESALTNVSSTLKTFLGFVRGAGVIVCVIMLAWCAIQLALSSGNQQKRAMAMEGIKNVLIAVAIIGSATLISGIAYGLIK